MQAGAFAPTAEVALEVAAMAAMEVAEVGADCAVAPAAARGRVQAHGGSADAECSVQW